MKLATDIWGAVRAYGEEKGLEMIKKAGFDAVDFSFRSSFGHAGILCVFQMTKAQR